MKQPWIQLKLRGIAVVLKPPTWEVDAKALYTSYVALQRYQDACYQDDAESKVFDVTGKRHLEIDAYTSIYSSSQKFLDDSKERIEYFHQPEVKCEIDFLLNKLYEENLNNYNI